MTSGGPQLSEAGYILPLKWHDDADLEPLCSYLEELSRWIPVLVVDGSPPEVFAAHARAFPVKCATAGPGTRAALTEKWRGY